MNTSSALYKRPQSPGYLGTYNWSAILLGLMALVATNIITTQYIASHFDYQPALGPPLFQIASLSYTPVQMVPWILRFGNSADPLVRQPLLTSTLIAAVGFATSLFLVAALNIHRNKKLTENTEDLHGSARWANVKEIRNSGLVDQKHGVYIGAWHDEKTDSLEYLRHAGPEHILAFAPTRSGKASDLLFQRYSHGRERSHLRY